ncbi:hypothetical protein V8E54_000192 [Elaphomyces granulatus]
MWLWGDAPRLRESPDSLYDHLSWKILDRSCSRDEIEAYLESCAQRERICFIVDEIPYVAAGTFRLQDLSWKDEFPALGKLDHISPFNKTTFFGLPPLTVEEMAVVLRVFENAFCLKIPTTGGESKYPSAVLPQREPEVKTWPILLETKFEEHMNGVKYKIRRDLADPGLRQLVRRLAYPFCQYKPSPSRFLAQQGERVRAPFRNKQFDLDFKNLKPAEKRLLDNGTITPANRNQAGFTSHPIYRVCIDCVHPRRKIRLLPEEVENPIWLLAQALAYLRPSQITNGYYQNNDGPSEDIFHVELYCALRDLNVEILVKKLDLLLSKENCNYTGYELKVDEGTLVKFKSQTIGYALEHRVNIYLVNFVSMHKKINLELPKWPVTGPGEPEVIVVHVQYNDDYTHYIIRCLGESISVDALGDK